MGGCIVTRMALERTKLACIKTCGKIRAMQRENEIVNPGANMSGRGASMTFRLSGQIPSGKNAVVVTRTGMRFPAKRFKLWREQALAQLSKQGAGQQEPIGQTVSLECEYTPGDRRTRDVPGMLDALLHVIVKAGLLVDDGLVWAVTWRRNEMDRENPGLKFHISVTA